MRLSYPDAIRSITIKKTFTSFSALYYYHHHYTTLLHTLRHASVRPRSVGRSPTPSSNAAAIAPPHAAVAAA